MITERLLRVALLGSSWVLWLLVALSMISLAAMLERWLFFRRHNDDLSRLRYDLHKALYEDDYEAADDLLARSPSLEAKVVRRALGWREGGPDAVADVVESEIGRLRKDLERGLNLLGTLGNNTPFVGLLGTVLGVIEAFHHLSDPNNKAAMGNVMSGIAEALIATGVGLFVALPAVVAYNVAQKKVGEIENEILSLTKLVTAALKTREKLFARPGEPDVDPTIEARNPTKDERALTLQMAGLASEPS